MAAALASLIYLGNVRAYQTAVEGQRVVAQRTTDWPLRLYRADRSIGLFPPLANPTRQDFFELLVRDWNTISDREEAEAAMRLVQWEAAAIVDSQPRLWSAYVGLARVYQSAALLDPPLLEAARTYRATAEALAPGVPQVTALKARQQVVEEALESPPAR